MCFCTLGGCFLGSHGNLIGKHHVFVRNVLSANTSGNTLCRFKKYFLTLTGCLACGRSVVICTIVTRNMPRSNQIVAVTACESVCYSILCISSVNSPVGKGGIKRYATCEIEEIEHNINSSVNNNYDIDDDDENGEDGGGESEGNGHNDDHSHGHGRGRDRDYDRDLGRDRGPGRSWS